MQRTYSSCFFCKAAQPPTSTPAPPIVSNVSCLISSSRTQPYKNFQQPKHNLGFGNIQEEEAFLNVSILGALATSWLGVLFEQSEAIRTFCCRLKKISRSMSEISAVSSLASWCILTERCILEPEVWLMIYIMCLFTCKVSWGFPDGRNDLKLALKTRWGRCHTLCKSSEYRCNAHFFFFSVYFTYPSYTFHS